MVGEAIQNMSASFYYYFKQEKKVLYFPVHFWVEDESYYILNLFFVSVRYDSVWKQMKLWS